MINQRDARVFVRVRWAGVLTFAAISEVGLGGRRVEVGHRFEFTVAILSVGAQRVTVLSPPRCAVRVPVASSLVPRQPEPRIARTTRQCRA